VIVVEDWKFAAAELCFMKGTRRQPRTVYRSNCGQPRVCTFFEGRTELLGSQPDPDSQGGRLR
jgi:hypothetical protein